jgi:hypothetical protein
MSMEDLAVRCRAGLVAVCALALFIMPNNLHASEPQSAQRTASSLAEPAPPSFDPLVPEITDIAEPGAEGASGDDIGPS